MRNTILSLLLAVLIVFPAASARGAQPGQPGRDMADRIQTRYEQLKSFTADFSQTLTNAASGQAETRSGKIWFGQPSRVRWVTEKPDGEVLVIGPEFAWDYLEDENVAIKYRVEGLLSSKTILRFISGKANLREDFVIKTDWQGADDVRARWGKGLTILQLVPKEPEPGMVLAFVGVEPDTALFRQIMIVDFYGNGNEVRLDNVKLDQPLGDDLFEFTPPDGVEVEDNTGS